MPTHVSKLGTQKAAARSRFVAALNDFNLIATVLLCVVGVLITAVVMLRFPHLGAIIAQYNQF